MLANSSRFDIEGWHFEAVAGRRKMVASVRPAPDQLAGVTYHEPDGEKVYCYNSETASARLELYERSRSRWRASATLLSAGRCHFEYGQRAPVPGLDLLTQ